MVSASDDGTVSVWDIRSGEELFQIYGHSGGVRSLQFDREQLVTDGECFSLERGGGGRGGVAVRRSVVWCGVVWCGVMRCGSVGNAVSSSGNVRCRVTWSVFTGSLWRSRVWTGLVSWLMRPSIDSLSDRGPPPGPSTFVCGHIWYRRDRVTSRNDRQAENFPARNPRKFFRSSIAFKNVIRLRERVSIRASTTLAFSRIPLRSFFPSRLATLFFRSCLPFSGTGESLYLHDFTGRRGAPAVIGSDSPSGDDGDDDDEGSGGSSQGDFRIGGAGGGEGGRGPGRGEGGGGGDSGSGSGGDTGVTDS